jgi:hypothetical protein
MPYVEVPIIGSGEGRTHGGDPYRAALSVPKSAVIPTDKDGKPLYTTTIVWVDDKNETEIPRDRRRIPEKEARRLLREMDPQLDVKGRRANLQSTRQR